MLPWFRWNYTIIWQSIKLTINSSPPSAAYMRQWAGSALVQVMACRVLDAKPLPEPMLTYCQLDSWQHILVKFESEFYHFHSRKNAIENVCQTGGHLVQGGWVNGLTHCFKFQTNHQVLKQRCGLYVLIDLIEEGARLCIDIYNMFVNLC